MLNITLKTKGRPFQKNDYNLPRIKGIPSHSRLTLKKGIVVCISYLQKLSNDDNPRLFEIYDKNNQKGLFVDEYRVYNFDQLMTLYLTFIIYYRNRPHSELFWIK